MNTKALRQKILDLAIHGRLVPPVCRQAGKDPNDEPASALLRRIHEEKERLIKEGKIKKGKKSAKTSDTAHYENVPFEVPESWEWTTLGDICLIKGGKRIPKGMSFSKEKTEHIYLRVTNMKLNTIILDDLKYISDEVYNLIKNYTISSSDLYLTIAGTIGSVGIIPQEVDGMNLTENAAKLTNIACDKKYLLYALQSTVTQEHFTSKFHQVAQPKLSIETASSANIPLPPLPEQRRIVAEIERWFSLIDIIETNKASLQTSVKQAKAKILDLAIHGKLVPQDPNDEPASELLRRINPKAEITSDNAPFEVPSGWCRCRLHDVVTIINGRSQKDVEDANGNYPIYGSGGIIGRATDYLCEAGSTIIGRKGTINNPIFVDERFWNIDTAFGMKPQYAISDLYFYYFCKSFDFSKLDKSTALPSLKQSTIGGIYIPLPPLAEQHRIVAKIEEIFARLDRIEAEL